MPDEQAFQECLDLIQRGVLTFDEPGMYASKYWLMRYEKDLPKARVEIAALTVEKVERLIKNYIKKHGIERGYESLEHSKLAVSTEAINASVERFFMRDKEMEQKIIELPRIRRHELAKICQPGDIVLAYPGKFKATANKLFYFLTSKGQGMAFSSLKMVGCENDVIGYGLKGDASLAKISLNSLPTRYKGILILRSKKMTPEKAKLIYAWVKDKFKKKVPYDFIGMGLSVIRRLFKVMGKTLETGQIDKNIRKLYCSVIISLAYKRYGVPTGITSVGDFDVFPKDFFYSKEFVKIGAYFAKGEVQSANESLNIDIESKMSNISLDDISSMIDVSENSELPISEVSKIILQNYIEKTLRHKDLVKRCGIELLPYLNKYNVDKDVFLKNLEEHDDDKFENNIAPIYAVATQYLYNDNINTLFEPKDGVLDEFNKVAWVKHYTKNEHHVGEHFGTSGFRTIYKHTVVDDNHPLAIAEMIADWMAMGLEMNNSANAWWKKCLAERKYHFQENDTNLIEELLKVESDIVSKITNNSTQLDDKITDVDPMDAIMMKPIESNESLNIRSSIDTIDSRVKKVLSILSTYKYGIYIKDVGLITDP